MKAPLTFLLLAVMASILSAQQDLLVPDLLDRRVIMQSAPVQAHPDNFKQYKIPGKKASQYTAEDWG